MKYFEKRKLFEHFPNFQRNVMLAGCGVLAARGSGGVQLRHAKKCFVVQKEKILVYFTCFARCFSHILQRSVQAIVRKRSGVLTSTLVNYLFCAKRFSIVEKPLSANSFLSKTRSSLTGTQPQAHVSISGAVSPNIFLLKSEQQYLVWVTTLSKHKTTIYARNLGGHGPLPPPGYAYGFKLYLFRFWWLAPSGTFFSWLCIFIKLTGAVRPRQKISFEKLSLLLLETFPALIKVTRLMWSIERLHYFGIASSSALALQVALEWRPSAWLS